jgi:2-polyprenyl-3-methyl-5-hydroxy-6-metoxy-1,4-benzoquinol methylase
LPADTKTCLWQPKELECLDRCPVCGTSAGPPIHKDLEDLTFDCGGSGWSIFRCGGCGSGYLNPRPTSGSIGRAYSTYYTHSETSALNALEASTSISSMFARSYLNRRYGISFTNLFLWGAPAVRMLPFRRRMLDAGIGRNLPAPRDRTRRLLDVGCGSGEFLEFAVRAGWEAQGVDNDPAALAEAQRRGLKVSSVCPHGLNFDEGRFDVVTMGHVIEHVHDPRTLLEECFRVLSPQGLLWLETPNIESIGHRLFRRAWRGLEPPRHLIVYSERALRQSLEDAGFTIIELPFHAAVTKDIWAASRLIAERDGSSQHWSIARRFGVSEIGRRTAEAISFVLPRAREFLTVLARRA